MNSYVYNTISVVIPAYNEGKTLNHVIDETLKLKMVSEIIFVDDGSIDNTLKKVEKYNNNKRFIYIKHPKNKGKGKTLKTGINKAKNEIILLLDADLKNITAQKIKKIITPVIRGEVDVSRAGFRLARGRVTEIAVKPMMKILFPGIYFDQPISGQVCAKKEFLQKADLEDKWGVDIGILLDAIQDGQKIVEVNIGKLDHKARTDKEKAEMAEQVLKTMIEKAGLIRHKYKLIILTLDNTLVQKSSLELLFKKLNISAQMEKLSLDLKDDKITFETFAEESAVLFKNIKKETIIELYQHIKLANYAQEVISSLKKRKYQVALISSNFSVIASTIAKRLGIDIIDCPHLDESRGVMTGFINKSSKKKWASNDLEVSFYNAFKRVLNRIKVKPVEVIMVANSSKSLPIFNKVGLSIAYQPKSKLFKEKADKTIKILPELLAIIE